jgi:hypothetical protein
MEFPDFGSFPPEKVWNETQPGLCETNHRRLPAGLAPTKRVALITKTGESFEEVGGHTEVAAALNDLAGVDRP